jgi:transcriptional regulator with XRE-family HTH domain/Zn-dependent peptidase ImmA (M78 family)
MNARNNQQLIALRIKCHREQARLTQEDFAEEAGFASHQIVSQIETGQRGIAADELVRIADVLHTSLYALSDPYVLGHEAKFVWTGTSLDHTGACEAAVSKALAFYRVMQWGESAAISPTREVLNLRDNADEEEVAKLGEGYGNRLALGSRPSAVLYDAIAKNPAMPIVATPTGLSVFSGACFTHEFSAIVINSEDSPALRAYALAARVFDCMSCHVFEPQTHVIGNRFQPGRAVNHLGRSFAAALLLPHQEMARQWKVCAPERIWNTVHDIAVEMSVPVQVVIDRAAQLRLIKAKTKQDLLKREGANPQSSRSKGDPRCPRFSRLIMEACLISIDKGSVSVRKLCSLLGVTIDELQAEFEAHRLTPPFDL